MVNHQLGGQEVFILFVLPITLNARKKTTVGDKPGSKLERQKILKYAYVRSYLVITVNI